MRWRRWNKRKVLFFCLKHHRFVILNECEVSHVRLSRFLHFVFEMTKLCFPAVMPNACEASLLAIGKYSYHYLCNDQQK